VQDFFHQCKRNVDIRAIGHAHRNVELPDPAAIVENLADDLAIRDHHLRPVRVSQRGAEQTDVEDFTFFLGDRNVFADMEGPREDDGKARGDIAEYPLHRQRHCRAGHTEARNQRHQFDTEILQRQYGEDPQDQDPGNAYQQNTHRRVKVEADQHALQNPTHPASDQMADKKNDQRYHQLRPEPDRHVQGRSLHLIK
jgi:hypothetical protein